MSYRVHHLQEAWKSLIKEKSLSYYSTFILVRVIGFSKRLKGKVW